MAEIGHPSQIEYSPRFRAAVIIAATVALTITYTAVPAEYRLANKLLQYSFFLPPVMAALWFGWRGAILSALFCSVCYLPGLLLFWRKTPAYGAEQYGEALDLFLIGAILGVLADRERRRRQELEAATRQLSATYRQLQENLEHLKRAERLSAIGHLAASLAHEIRNPLASIEGAADLLAGPLNDDMRREFLDIIRKECRRLSRLLTEMLDYARPRPPNYAPVSLNTLIDSVATLSAVSAQKKAITLALDLAPDLPPVECDAEQIKQVILNLTINAIQAMDCPGEVKLAAFRRNGNVVIEVRDHGPGVPDDALEKIFSPFFTTKKDGTGLGLAVAQQIVTRHGGMIMVDPNQPRGAVFTVLLPVHRPPAIE